jgi:phage gpG-like protein
MQRFQQLFNQLLKDIRIELNDEFDRNFERKAFFTTAWQPAKHSTIGSLMMRTGALRKSLRSQIIGNNAIKWESSLPYADIHNSGGTITVTPKMKGFFWYRFRAATGGNDKNLNRQINGANEEALFWKAMALKPVGSVIIIPKRQFIGDHPMVRQSIRNVSDDWFNNDVKKFINNQLNNIVG